MTILAVMLVAFAVFAGFFAPYDPLETDYVHMLEAPGSAHWFGTDQLGRDLLSRILYGGRSSLLIAFAVTMIVAESVFSSVQQLDLQEVYLIVC